MTCDHCITPLSVPRRRVHLGSEHEVELSTTIPGKETLNFPPDSSLSSVDSPDTWNCGEKLGPAPTMEGGNNLALFVPLKILALSEEWLKVPGYYIWMIILPFTDRVPL